MREREINCYPSIGTNRYPSIAFRADSWKKFRGEFTFVYLDIDDASVLRDCCNIRQKVRQVLEKEGYGTSATEFKGYVDEGTLSDEYLEKCWEEYDILMTVVDKGDVKGRVEWMYVDILRRLDNVLRRRDSLRNMLILSKDKDMKEYSRIIEDLGGENLNIGIADLGAYLKEVEVEEEVEDEEEAKACSVVHYHFEDEDEDEDENEARLDKFKLFSRLFAKKEEMHIHMVGLHGSGKTTILHKLELGEMFTLSPAVGFSVEIAEYKNISFPTWDVGDQHNMRTLGSDCFQYIRGLIFVVDSNDRDRVVEARDELQKMLKEDEWRDAMLLVFANKQDLPNAMNAAELTDKLELHSLCQRHWHIQSTCTTSGEGLHEGLEWLSNNIANMAQSKSQAATDEPTSTMESPNKIAKKIDLPVIGHEEGNIGVFWNVNDYPVACEDPETIYTSMKQTLEGADFKGEVSIKVYVDDDKLSPELLEKYKGAGFDIKTFGNRGKGGRARLLLTDVLWWTMHNHQPANIFLLSKDAELIPYLEALYSQKYGVFVSDAEPTKDHPNIHLPCVCLDWLLSDAISP